MNPQQPTSPFQVNGIEQREVSMASNYSSTKPTRSLRTKARYSHLYKLMRDQFMRESGRYDLTAEEVVAIAIQKKHESCMSSWRSTKAVLMFALETKFPQFTAALEALEAESSAGLEKFSSKTSGQKKKFVPAAQWAALQSTLRQRISREHKHAQGLLYVLTATLLTGLRPNEWCHSHRSIHAATGRPVLRVRNSKVSNGRANGDFREMFIDGLDAVELEAVDGALAYCSCDNDDDAQRIETAMKNELENARDRTLSNRQQTQSSITLYSFRHQFVANAKQTFQKPELIAALAGHSSTKTAFEHYGKRRNGTGVVKVVPTPESLEAVLKVTLEIYKDFVLSRSRTSTFRPS